jgi:WD40 repeat protein
MTPNPDKLKAGTKHGLKFIGMGLARRADGKLFVAGSDFKVYQIALEPKLELTEIGNHASYVTSAAITGNTLITCGYDQQVTWWDTDKRTKIRSIEAHEKWVRNVALSPDGKFVASVGDDMVAKIFEVASGKLVHTLKGHKERTPTHFPSMLYAVAWSADGKTLATADKVGTIQTWDTTTGKIVKTLEAPGFYTWDGRQRIHSIGGIRSLAFSPDGKYLAAGGTGKIGNIDHLEAAARIEIFDWKSDAKPILFDKAKNKGLVNRLAFAPNGNWLVGSGGAGNGFLWFVDVAGQKVLKEEAVSFHVHGMALNDKADEIVVAGHNNIAAYSLKG